MRLEGLARGLAAAGRNRLGAARSRFGITARALHAVSPLATLDRGYAIVTDGADHVVTDASTVAPGSTISARLARGRLRATVVAAVAAPAGTTDGDPT